MGLTHIAQASLCGFLALGPASLARAAAATSTLQFRVVTDFGHILPYSVESLIRTDHGDGRNLAGLCRSLRCAGLPKFAAYDYTLIATDIGRRLKGKVLVFQSEVLVVESTGPSAGTAGDGSGYQVRGQVAGLPHGSGMNWISLQNPFTGYSIKTVLDSGGRFTLDYLNPGNRLLLVFHDGDLLHMQAVTLRNETGGPIDLMIRLP